MTDKKNRLEHETYTRRELCELFRIHRSTVIRWEKAGYLRPVTPPGSKAIRYLKADIERLLRTRGKEKEE